MHVSIGIPSCFSFVKKASDAVVQGLVTRPGQTIHMYVYRTKVADKCRLITITWCKNSSLRGLSVSVENPEGETQNSCKVELKPWYFWRKQGSKRFIADGKLIDCFWDLKTAKFNDETEPIRQYYVAVVCDQKIVLLVGDLWNEACRRIGFKPALFEPILVAKKEHKLWKRKFSTNARFHEQGRLHEISVECKNRKSGDLSPVSVVQPELEIRVDGNLVIHVKNLLWKFRGNESVILNMMRVEVYWDVHDWLFSPGLKHALFIFRPIFSSPSTASSISSFSSSSSSPSTPTSTQTENSDSVEGLSNVTGGISSEFSLFLYAWKVE
ncbi:hypothetical protein TanjilG_27469 [Lupinus angustifolius]|uniref:DUF868 domain-containing protein n=1 Tax=Lupinus angustifolius TaxID=3871 RepID=A0A4P1R302_LUPAN|nr:PREDICTED: uncharacterized protein LOC109361755 [Lupinus angustifolius]OIW00218.1 hypothetical protein TanjilG_27469 [Lupinus angustifolius]